MIDQLLLKARELFQPHNDEQSSIPQQSPPLPWDTDQQIFVVATQLAHSYWLRYAFLRHQIAIERLKAANIDFRPYRDAIPWEGEFIPLYALFDMSVEDRKEALQWCFFSMDASDVALLQDTIARLQAEDLQTQRAHVILELMLAMVELRQQTHDLWGEPLPTTIFEIMRTYLAAPNYHNQGNMNENKLITLGKPGAQYFVKTADELDSGLTTPEQDQADEAAATAALRALDWNIGAKTAYHIIGCDGNHYSLVQRVRGSMIEDPSVAAQSVSEQNVQRAVLAEYLLSLYDRHHRNVLVDRQTQRVREIDFAGAFKAETPDGVDCFLGYEEVGSLGKVTLSHARAIWDVHPDTRFASPESPIFARTILEEAVQRRAAVLQALERYRRPEATAVVERRFAIVEEALRRFAGDIALKDLESCRQMFYSKKEG